MGLAIAMLWYVDGWKGHPFLKTLSRTGQPLELERDTTGSCVLSHLFIWLIKAALIYMGDFKLN